MKRFVIGDIHGAYLALKQVLICSKFNYKHDLLVILGDVCDSNPQTKECVNELLKIKNRIFIRGNHDQWFIDYLTKKPVKQENRTPLCNEDIDILWFKQGGKATLESYGHDIPKKHKKFFLESQLYHVMDDMLFVHGGFDPSRPIDNQDSNYLMWDRHLWKNARQTNKRRKEFKDIFIGHTSTEKYSLKPIRNGNIWNMDQGSGWDGVLSIMDIDTKEFWTSDNVKRLYLQQTLLELYENQNIIGINNEWNSSFRSSF